MSWIGKVEQYSLYM